ncbi:MAG: HAMP domain-containing sensor histidine kinase [Acidimicrobiales bacterium]
MTPTPTPTPSLHRRLVGVSVAFVVVSIIALDVLVYLSVRDTLAANPGLPPASVDASLRRLVAIEAVGAVVAAGLVALLLSWVARVTLRPLQKMLGVVRSQTVARTGERIRPVKCRCLMGELGRAYDEMLDAQEAAIAETNAARDRSQRFLADAAHQIRTPVAGIQAGAETLLRQSRSSNGDEQRLLTEMLQETSRVGRLVTDLLQAARLDQGMQLEPAPCDVVAVCRHEADRVQRVEPSLTVTTDAPGWNGQRPALDARAVHEIVGNLLDNARRHARSRVEVSVIGSTGSIEVRVGDDGPGLPDQATARVFERFVSLDGRGGSGLGLPIAQDLARAHGGDIRYEAGQFVVTLPSAPDASDAAPEQRQRRPAASGAR